MAFNIYQQLAQSVENSSNRLALQNKKGRKHRPTARFSSIFHRILAWRGLGPLTPRTIVILLALAYLLAGPVRGSTDIVAASLAYTLLTLLAFTAFAVLAGGLTLKRKLTATVSPPESQNTSQENVRVVITLSSAPVLPFCVLELSLFFAHPGTTAAKARVLSYSKDSRRVTLDLSFPHRGSWDILAIRCAYRDTTGFINYVWDIPQQTSVVVSPPHFHESLLPVLSSTQRPGEMLVDLHNRQGDPFDIKAYHPTDGVHRIVWKAFAKRGELLSRHPEASMTPEGFVVMYVIAATLDDKICGHALAYTQSLSKLNLEIIASCVGACGRPTARTPEQLQELLVDSVWDTEKVPNLQTDAANLLDYCAQLTPGVTVAKLILFTSRNAASDETQSKEIYRLACWLQEQGITPVFCLSPAELSKDASSPSRLTALKDLLVSPVEDASPSFSASAYNSFLTECLRHQWEVHV